MKTVTKTVRGVIIITPDDIRLRLPLTRPLTPDEQREVKQRLEQYFSETYEYFGFAADGDIFDVIPSPRTIHTTSITKFREVIKFLAGPNITLQMVSERRRLRKELINKG
ncbi:MAG: hypothetical protein WAV46_03115 [Candidatus Moraniibacteriota bacterium]